MNGISRRIKNFLIEDFSYKSFAFLLAVLIWLFVSQQVEQEIYRHAESKSFDGLPVRALVEHKSKLKVDSEMPSVGVVLRGPRDVLRELGKEDIQPFVNIADFDKPGEYTVPVKIWLGEDTVKVEYLTPRLLEIELVEAD